MTAQMFNIILGVKNIIESLRDLNLKSLIIDPIMNTLSKSLKNHGLLK